MQYDGSLQIAEGVADVDPETSPENILATHIFHPGRHVTTSPSKLLLTLVGTGTEDVTLDLYSLMEDSPEHADDKYIAADKRWVPFAEGVIVRNGELKELATNLPAGGVMYGRVMDETITGGQTRNLLVSWV